MRILVFSENYPKIFKKGGSGGGSSRGSDFFENRGHPIDKVVWNAVVKPYLAHTATFYFFGLVFEIQRRPPFLRQGPLQGICKKRESQCRVRMQGRNWPRSDRWATERRLVIELDPKELRSERFLIKICVTRVAQVCLLRSSDLSRFNLSDIQEILSRDGLGQHRLFVCVSCMLCILWFLRAVERDWWRPRANFHALEH